MFRSKLYSMITATVLFTTTSAVILPQPAFALTGPVYENTFLASEKDSINIDYTIDVLQNGKIVQVVSQDIYYQKIYEETITRGIRSFRFERLDAKGWLRGNILIADLQDSNVRTDLLHNGTVSSKQTLSAMVKNAGAVAGVNGDFFDIGKTNVPLGVEIQDNSIIKSSHNWNQSIGVTNDGLGFISRILFGGAVKNISRNAKIVPLNGVNEVKPVSGQIVLYNNAWGHASRSGLIGTGVPFTEVVIQDNVVAEVLENKLYSKPLDANTTVLLGLGDAASHLKASFAVGEQVEAIYSSDPDFRNIRFALSGDVLIVENGKPVSHPSNPYSHPRTAVGFDQSYTKMYVAVIEGRYEGSRGMTYDELGIFMTSLGAWNAINLDSGGSSELVARPLAETAPVIANRPSEGTERQIPNGIGFWSTAPAGNLAGFVLKPLQNQNRVFQGFTRTITAKAYDEFFNPLSATYDLGWATGNSGIGTFSAKGVFKGISRGKVTAAAASGKKGGTIEMQVLGKPVQIYPSVRSVDFTFTKSAGFTISGVDDAGYEALIEPRDISLKYDQSLLEIKADSSGRYSIKPLRDDFATIVTVSAGGLQTFIGVTAGIEKKIINTFDNAAEWSFISQPAGTNGSVTFSQTEHSGSALKLSYDFTKTTATRMADIKAMPGPIELPGKPIRIGVRISGDNGHGEWLRMNLRDSNGKVFYVDLDKSVGWKGWKYVTANIPSEAAYPVFLDRIYVVEQNASKKYIGSIVMDDLTLEYLKHINLPAEQQADEPILNDWDSLSFNAPKFAVISGMEFANTHDLSDVNRKEQILKQLMNEEVDFVIFNGGIVASDNANNYQLARDMLNSNLSIPFYIVPAQQDTSGTSNLNRFVQTFGSDFQKFDINETRFILLNSSLGSLRVSNPVQWQALLQWLKDSKNDDAIRNIIVVNQAPLNIASTLPARDLDSNEAQLLQELLTQIVEEGRKNITYISSAANEPTIKRLNGVLYIDTGYAAAPDYTLFGINPANDGKPVIKVKFTP